jgi:hypothetical protein
MLLAGVTLAIVLINVMLLVGTAVGLLVVVGAVVIGSTTIPNFRYQYLSMLEL